MNTPLFSQSTFDELVLCTVRYYLPRCSIAAVSFPTYELPALFDQCSEQIQTIIVRDIQQYLLDVKSTLVKPTFVEDLQYWREFLISKGYADE